MGGINYTPDGSPRGSWGWTFFLHTQICRNCERKVHFLNVSHNVCLRCNKEKIR